MEKRQARLIGHQVHGYAPKLRYDHGVFHNAARRLAIDFHDLEKMPMDVQGMVIVSAVTKEDAIFRARTKHKFVLVRKFLAVDGPVVEAMHAAGDLLEDHVDRLWRRRRRRGAAENGVVPGAIRGPQKLRLPFLVFVLDDDAQARIAIGIGGRTERPDARPVYIHETNHAPPGSHGGHLPPLRGWHPVAIQPEKLKFVASHGRLS